MLNITLLGKVVMEKWRNLRDSYVSRKLDKRTNTTKRDELMAFLNEVYLPSNRFNLDELSTSQHVVKNYLQLALESMHFNVPSVEHWTTNTDVEEDLIDPWTNISLTQPLLYSNSESNASFDYELSADNDLKFSSTISSDVMENLDGKSYIKWIKRDPIANYTIAYYVESMF